jgi:hypothetical protein
MVGKFSGKSKAEGTEENLTQSRKGAKETANGHECSRRKKNEPQMDPPSREAMAGKLQIYADEALPDGAPPRLRGRPSRVAVTYL